jgi:hypothetical protein
LGSFGFQAPALASIGLRDSSCFAVGELLVGQGGKLEPEEEKIWQPAGEEVAVVAVGRFGCGTG